MLTNLLGRDGTLSSLANKLVHTTTTTSSLANKLVHSTTTYIIIFFGR